MRRSKLHLITVIGKAVLSQRSGHNIRYQKYHLHIGECLLFGSKVYSSHMRLHEEERQVIQSVAREIFGETVRIRLFGSRIDDHRKGGDIDLHLEVDPDLCTLKNELRFQLELMKTLGERKVDVVLHKQGKPLKSIDEIAINTGVEL